MKHITTCLAFIIGSLCYQVSYAGGVYQEPEDFIQETFLNSEPSKKVIWLDKPIHAELEEILSHKYKGLRIRYWIAGTKTAWILEEVGKEKPITTGIVIENNKIQRIRILVFRESRGWEVRHAFFTDQFTNASLHANHRLDKGIDNISGATLSVRAVTKLSRVALLLHKKVVTAN